MTALAVCYSLALWRLGPMLLTGTPIAAPAPTATSRPSPTPSPPSPTPRPSPTPTAVASPTPTAELSTEQRLAEAIIPERDQLALANRLLRPPTPIPAVVNPTPPTYRIGDQDVFWVGDQVSRSHFTATATLRYITPHVYMWVQNGYDVPDDALQRSAERFENETYPTNHRFFGTEWIPGVDNDPHISIFNGRVPGAGGYFYSPNEYSRQINPYSNQREMFFINLDGRQPGTDGYDSTLAHEFQHMIHWYNDRNEDTWVNEGLSQLAEQLNGFTVSGGLIQTFAQTPDTQLTAWAESPGQALPHYGSSYLFMNYFLERFGEAAMRRVVASPANGPAGFDQALAAEGAGVTFEEVFADWLVANYVDDPALDGGHYGYRALDVGPPSLDARHDAYPVRRQATVHQYAADYVELAGQTGEVTVVFTGSTKVRLADTVPHSGRFVWWSNRGDDSDTRLTRAFDLSGLSAATLRFWLWYDIEADYDYAYVLASTDGGATWDILRGQHSTDSNPNGNSFGWAYTGRSGDGPQPEWVQEEVDLSPYAGREVLVRFEYVTDDAYNTSGLCVDDLSVPELGYADDVEGGDGGWQAEGFVRSDNVVPQRFLVQIIEFGQGVRVRRMTLDEAGHGRLTVSGLGQEVQRAVLVISGLAPATTEVGRYEYAVVPGG